MKSDLNILESRKVFLKCHLLHAPLLSVLDFVSSLLKPSANYKPASSVTLDKEYYVYLWETIVTIYIMYVVKHSIRANNIFNKKELTPCLVLCVKKRPWNRAKRGSFLQNLSTDNFSNICVPLSYQAGCFKWDRDWT